MLRQLYIRNYTLIDELDITLQPGFSVITGETGAGKSIILGAIGLLLGNRADSKTIKPGCDRCVTEAHFDLSRYSLGEFFKRHEIDEDPTDTILRRELTAAGKSRAFINDTPVSLSVMRELGEKLVDIHSQHQNLLLQKEDFQLQVVDIIADDKDLLDAYKQQYKQYREKEGQLQALRDEVARRKDSEDYLRYQYNELEQAQLREGEQKTLEQTTRSMSHAEEIKYALLTSGDNLEREEGGVVKILRDTCKQLETVTDFFPDAQPLADRIESCCIELKDISGEIATRAEKVDFDPARLEQLNGRLDTIYTLERKYHVEDIAQLITLRDNLKGQLSHIDHGDEEVKQLEEEVARLLATCEEKAKALTETRKQAATKAEKEMRTRLIPLGIPNVRFEVQIEKKNLGTDGADKVCFLFSANTGTPALPVSLVASGGEIARVMLSLKAMICGAIKLPTIIFDEIDTGVSGSVAEKMARIMREMGAAERQVISITHLPQIAALGKHHYKVEKQETPRGTISIMKQLTFEERVREIAQMLSGSDVTEAALANARTLLKVDSNFGLL